MCTVNDMGFYEVDNTINKFLEEYLMNCEKKHPMDCSGSMHYTNSIYKRGYSDGIDAFSDALEPTRVIYNPPATIVFWKNGDKTVVKCSPNEQFNKYYGFCAAVAKRLYDNNSRVTKIVNSGVWENMKADKKIKKKSETTKTESKTKKGSKKK